MSDINKFDLIFSLGEACSCSEILRKHFLQRYSYPFDWLFGSTFAGRCHILANKFDKFIEKEDLEYSYEERSIKCKAYHNKNNDITFNHDFPKEMPFDEAYGLVKEKYNRRIERLLSQIYKSNSVLIVYLEAPTTNHSIITNEEIIDGFSLIQEAFGKKISLLYIRNDNQCVRTEFLSENITKISLEYKNLNTEFDYLPDPQKLKNIFSKYQLQLPFGYVAAKKFVNFLICFIPFKSIKHNLRKNLHI